jgi:pyrimidine operon attenuation protein/uracil phosphoribosyltransferase
MTEKYCLIPKKLMLFYIVWLASWSKAFGFSDTILVEFNRGTFLAERLKSILEKKEYDPEIKLGYHITFFRDDFRRTDKPLEANKTKINFIVENKKVITMMFYSPVEAFDLPWLQYNLLAGRQRLNYLF